MKAIQKFVADDGTEFATEAEALAHDARVNAEASVEAYLATTELKGAQRTMSKNAILGYLGFNSQQLALALDNAETLLSTGITSGGGLVSGSVGGEVGSLADGGEIGNSSPSELVPEPMPEPSPESEATETTSRRGRRARSE